MLASKPRVQNTYSLLFSLTIIGLCLSSILHIQRTKLSLKENHLTREDYLKEEKSQQVNLQLLKQIPSLGFDNLVADLSYLQFLQYFGDTEAREEIGYTLSPEYFEILVNNDPKFIRPYFLMSPATSIFAGTPEKSINFIEQGIKSIQPNSDPNAYYLWLYKATDEMLFLGNNAAAIKSYEMAAQWAERINTPESEQSAANIRQTIRFLEEDPDSTIAHIGAWTMVLSSTSDEKTQQKAIQKIEELGGQIVITPEGSLTVKVPG